MKEIIATGATVDEAVKNGCKELGIDVNTAKYDILEEAKNGLFFRKPAKVRVFFIENYPADEVDNDDDFDEEDDEEIISAEESEEIEEDDDTAEELDNEEPVDDSAENDTAESEENAASEDYSAATEAAITYLSEILTTMGVRDLNITAEPSDERTILNIDGNDDDLGVVIGHRGDTLTSLQYLVSLAANNCCEGYFKVSLNVKNFREKREKTLETVASKTAYKATKLQKNIALEPMSPYERSIIHTAVQSIEGVTSWSVGENEKRHVVIGPEGLDEGGEGIPVKYAKVNNRNNRGGYGRGGYNRGGYNNRGGRGSYNNNRGGYRKNYRDGGYNRDDRGYRENRGYRDDRRDSYSKYNDRYNNDNRNEIKTKSNYESGFSYGKIDVNNDGEE